MCTLVIFQVPTKYFPQKQKLKKKVEILSTIFIRYFFRVLLFARYCARQCGSSSEETKPAGEVDRMLGTGASVHLGDRHSRARS